jgi:hypothetical protein
MIVVCSALGGAERVDGVWSFKTSSAVASISRRRRILSRMRFPSHVVPVKAHLHELFADNAAILDARAVGKKLRRHVDWFKLGRQFLYLLSEFERLDCCDEDLVLGAIGRRTTGSRVFVGAAAAVTAVAADGWKAVLGIHGRYSCFVDNVWAAAGTATRFLVMFMVMFMVRLFLVLFLKLLPMIAAAG